MAAMGSTNKRGWRRATTPWRNVLVWSAVLFLFYGTAVQAFRAPLATSPTHREHARSIAGSSWRTQAVVSGPFSSLSHGSVKSTYFQLNVAAEDNGAATSSSKSVTSSSSNERDDLLRQVVDLARHLGPVGVYQSQDDQDELERLSMLLRPYSDPAPARIPLAGTFDLVYSASPYVSSGRLWGPVHGRVTQEFTTPNDFCNHVDLGPVRLSLDVTCQPKSDTVVQVNFVETRVSLFGNTLVSAPAKGGGEWKYIFAGTLSADEAKANDADAAATRRKRFIRVLEAPNLFVIEQVLPPEL